MTQYRLIITLTQQGLQEIIESNQRIAIVQMVAGGGSDDAVVWVSFSPFMNNTITWNDDYDAYVSASPVSPGNTVFGMAQSGDVQTGWTYTVQNYQFSPQQGGPGGAITLVNEMGSEMTLGLMAQATVDGTVSVGVVSAAALENAMSVSLTPQSTVAVFLSQSPAGTVITSLPSNALVVSLAGNPTASIGFSAGTKSFYLMG